MNLKEIVPLRIRLFRRNLVDTFVNFWCTKKFSRIPEAACPTIYYLGVTTHRNLGDLAQHYCIRSWLKNNYPTHRMLEFSSKVVIDQRFGFMKTLQSKLNSDDMIVFQSGYTTQDLGGNHEFMHRLVIDNLPEAKILMMPQTIFFQEEANRRRTEVSYNKAKNMLFLARDKISYDMALDMFPDVHVRLYPDIVTSLIGTYDFSHVKRDKAYLCCRNDSEKYYSDAALGVLKKKLEQHLPVDRSDTQSPVSLRKTLSNLQYYIEEEIAKFSEYRVTITDRYHGTIFSLAANTPVVIIKTTDHKVTTGAEWFRGIYDEHVFVADSLDHAYDLARRIIECPPKRDLPPYFDEEYYGKLKQLVCDTIE
ncbi:polysaccharide pyruvyl transferase family protein [Pontiellaceae bacterium B12227]|nr:polysaccharide pyruvyl transferase family protein [Pontiellaceae bacterium B12227]